MKIITNADSFCQYIIKMYVNRYYVAEDSIPLYRLMESSC